MDDELNLDLDENNQGEIINRKDKKIKSLSEKYEISEKEKADLAKAKEEADAKALAAQKDADFFKGFNQISTKYAGSSEYQDKIREKVALGLDIEDATKLIMVNEGKYTPPAPERESPIGGSASTGIADIGEKNPKDMTQDERRSILKDLEAKGEFKL